MNRARLLLDLTLRLQVLAEGVKVTESRFFDAVLSQIDTAFADLLGKLRFDKLDQLTKQQLAELVATLRRKQVTLYSIHLDKVQKRLKDFMLASLKVNRIVYAYAAVALDRDDPDVAIPSDEQASDIIAAHNRANDVTALFGLAAIKKGSDTLWPKILNEPLPAGGALLPNLLSALAGSASVGLENSIRNGYANSMTSQQTIAAGTKKLNVVANQAEAVVATSMQHISSVVSASIASGLYGRYRWLSVIDGNTTEICLSRNGKVYRYGQGPLPPAHYKCRSSIQPVVGEDEDESVTFYSWIKDQPNDIQNFALGNIVAGKLREQKLQAKDITKLTDPKPMSIADYGNAAKFVIRGEE